ncbi:protein phosphatase 2C [Echria macrotheca]|uniref:Protein phosphatase 2C n=1 Tax=Echria macrotheca TaxID=438768 RepID=A0AAJ0BMW9_9PEZI|nr:protein phosphatase 2C [Echria macrotheca]
MHRAAVKALRTTLQCTARTFRASRRGPLALLPTSSTLSSLTGARSPAFLKPPASSRYFSSSPIARSSRPRPVQITGEPLRASMYIRRTSFALVSALVGYGAWYSYGGNAPNAAIRSYTTPENAPGDAAPTRSVLVIGADELHTGTYVGEGPISKATGDGQMVVEMLSPDQATKKLRKMEESYFVNRGRGVVRYDVTQLPSNSPIEDDHDEKIVEVGAGAGKTNDWMFWGVFDGHSGWSTSAKLRQALVKTVAGELNETYKAAHGFTPSAEAVNAAIKNGFLRLDDEIVNQSVQKVFQSQSKSTAAEILAPANSGSCALLSFYDSSSKLLRVACTGDSRAVLGRKSKSGKWTAIPLSVDQTGSNPKEAARVRKEHPGEEPVRNGRILGGLEPSRAFGDASYKWTREIMDRLSPHYFARPPKTLLKTPPYVTAEPAVTTIKIEPENGDFLVMATDGLWEMLTNEEVIGLVGKWIESQAASTKNQQFNSFWTRIWGSKTELPVEEGKHNQADDADGQKSPQELMRRRGLTPGRERFVVQDKNVATHIVRNALGGSNQEQVSALLTLPYPTSRRYRDDLTVQVIFFGNGEDKGDVAVNDEATAPSKAAPKAKL